MKNYEIINKSSANGIRYGVLMRDGDKIIKIFGTMEKSIFESYIANLQKLGYEKRINHIMKAFHEASDGSGELTEAQKSILDNLKG